MIPWRIILAKYQVGHSYNFWTMPILIFSPVQIIMRHPLHVNQILTFLQFPHLSLIMKITCCIRLWNQLFGGGEVNHTTQVFSGLFTQPLVESKKMYIISSHYTYSPHIQKFHLPYLNISQNYFFEIPPCVKMVIFVDDFVEKTSSTKKNEAKENE